LFPGTYVGTLNGSGSGYTYYVHGFRFDPSGTWAIITTNSGDCISGGCNVYNFWQLSTTTVLSSTSIYVQNGHMTESASGWFNSDGNGQIQGALSLLYRPWANVTATTFPPIVELSSITTVTPDPNMDTHCGARNDVYGTNYLPVFCTMWAPDDQGETTYPYSMEVNAFFQSNPPSPILRFGHTFDSGTNARGYYADLNGGSISSTGKYYLVTTDGLGTLGSLSGGSSCTLTSGNCRTDVLIMNLVPISTTVHNVTCSGDISIPLQAAVNAAVDGDIVSITAGSCTISVPINLPCTSWTMLGAGPSATNVTVNISSGATSPLNLTGCSRKSFRISGIYFTESAVGLGGVIYVSDGIGISYRVDHNTFDSSSAWHRFMWINEPCSSPGCVWDHNTIIDAGGLISAEAVPTDGGYPGCAGSSDNCAGQAMWTQPMYYDNGTEAYFENNTFAFNNFYANKMLECDRGGRYVFRYNTVSGNNLLGDGFESQPNGCLEISAYQNIIDGIGQSQANVLLRGGTGLIYSNIVKGVSVGTNTGNILLTNYRSTGACVPLSACSVAGASPYCGGGNAKDGNVTNGYPCFAQLGRGGVSSGAFGLTSYPLYQWDNCTSGTLNGGIIGCTGGASQAHANVYTICPTRNPCTVNGTSYNDYTFADIKANRDYYESQNSCNSAQSTGICIGLANAKAGNCSAGVAYWATDTKTLYRCGSSNTWSTYYTPFTYPYPLLRGQVHYVGVGSSAMFNGFALATYNDFIIGDNLTNSVTAATPGHCPVGDVCVAKHWTGAGFCNDTRTNGAGITPPSQSGDLWIVWVEDTTAGVALDSWAFLSVDSTVGVRCFLARPQTTLVTTSMAGTAGANTITNTLFGDSSLDSTISAAVLAILNQPAGINFSAAMTDIRMEDALHATLRTLGNCPAAGCNTAHGQLVANTCPSSDTGIPSSNPTPPTPCNNYPYAQSYTLGYGPGNIGTEIKSDFSSNLVTSVAFALPGFDDPFSNAQVPGTIQTFAVGESPIIMIANRHNAQGLGQVLPAVPACNGLNNGTDSVECVNDPANGGPIANGGNGHGFNDGSYQIRNMWDQHPYPPVAGRFTDTSYTPANAGSGLCSNPAFSGTGPCKVNRRPLGALFAGNECETVSTAFTWPEDSALEGVRPNPASIVPVNLLISDPLSGTYNTFEYTAVRRFGGTAGNFSYDPVQARWGYAPDLSQESDVDGSGTTPPIGNTFNPLAEQCQAGFQDPLGQTGEGFRYRALGTREMVNQVYNSNAEADRIGYIFFSFGNVDPNTGANPPMPRNQNYGYLMIDAVDPLFQDYANNAREPGQPAGPGVPLSWGELPNCVPGGGVGVPDCKANAIWLTTTAANATAHCPTGTVCTYPHLRDGTYPAWSELRMMCDAEVHGCLAPPSTGADPYGAEALVQNLQADIHFNRGVPDLLPFSDASAGALSFNPPYGDVTFIRDHSAVLPAGTQFPAGSGHASTDQYSTYVLADDQQDTVHNIPPYFSSYNPQTQRQTIPAMPTVCGGAAGTNSPPNQECGGDVGGWIIPVPAGVTSAMGQLQ
jgi:hypothetical protein